MTFAAEEAGQILSQDARGRVLVSRERRESLLEEYDRSGMSGVEFAQYEFRTAEVLFVRRVALDTMGTIRKSLRVKSENKRSRLMASINVILPPPPLKRNNIRHSSIGQLKARFASAIN